MKQKFRFSFLETNTRNLIKRRKLVNFQKFLLFLVKLKAHLGQGPMKESIRKKLNHFLL